MYEIESANRIFGEPYSRVDMAPLLIQNEYTGAVIKQAQDDVYYSLPINSRTFDNGLNDGIIIYIQNAINATIQGLSYNDALQTAKKGIDQLIDRYKIE
jgi:multiple sugar transport system substrate-binding protein